MKDLSDIVVVLMAMSCGMSTSGMGAPLCPPSGTTDVCANCVERGQCIDGVYKAGKACPSGKACALRDGAAACKFTDRVPGCSCKTSPGIGCDAYDIDSTVFCYPTDNGIAVSKGDNCSTQNSTYSCKAGRCEKNPCKSISTTGFINEKPECNAGHFCQNRRSMYSKYCPSGQYYNIDDYDCKDIPSEPCAGCTSQKCPIISDCTKYAECSSGTLQDIKTCIPNTYFNPNTQDCGASRTGVCVGYEGCEFPLLMTKIAVTTGTTATDATTINSSPTDTETTDTTTTDETTTEAITTGTKPTDTTITDTTTTTDTTIADTTTTEPTTAETTNFGATTTDIPTFETANGAATIEATADTTTTDSTASDITTTDATNTDSTTTDLTTTDATIGDTTVINTITDTTTIDETTTDTTTTDSTATDSATSDATTADSTTTDSTTTDATTADTSTTNTITDTTTIGATNTDTTTTDSTTTNSATSDSTTTDSTPTDSTTTDATTADATTTVSITDTTTIDATTTDTTTTDSTTTDTMTTDSTTTDSTTTSATTADTATTDTTTGTKTTDATTTDTTTSGSTTTVTMTTDSTTTDSTITDATTTDLTMTGSTTTDSTITDVTTTTDTTTTGTIIITTGTTTTTTTAKPAQCTAAYANERFPHETDCKKYYTCRRSTGTTYEYAVSTCISNYVFNPANGYCDLPSNVPSCSTQASQPVTPPTTTKPPTKPAQCTASDANKRFPHETDCKMYYTCRLNPNSGYGFIPATCPESYVFNPASNFCDLAANVPSCSSQTPATLASTFTSTTAPTTSNPTTVKPTTAKPSTKPAQCTAAIANKKFPHETDCKQYYTCRLTTSTKYEFALSKCTSYYVFNPANNYCDLPSNVPGCMVPV